MHRQITSNGGFFYLNRIFDIKIDESNLINPSDHQKINKNKQMKKCYFFVILNLIYISTNAQNSFIKLLKLDNGFQVGTQIEQFNNDLYIGYYHVDSIRRNFYSGILKMDINATILNNNKFWDFDNNSNSIVFDKERKKLFLTGEGYGLTGIVPQSFRIYELDPYSLDSLKIVEAIDNSRIYPIIYQTNSAIHNNHLVVVGSGTIENKANIMKAYIDVEKLKLDTIIHIGEDLGSISTRSLYVDMDGNLVHHTKYINFGDTVAILKFGKNKELNQIIKIKDKYCPGKTAWPFGCQLSDGRTVYNRCGDDDLPEIVFLADSTYEIVDKFEWRKNLPPESPYPGRQGRKTFKLIEARNGDIMGVGSIRWSDAPTPNIISYAPLIFRINNKGDLLWYKALYNKSNISAWTIGAFYGVTELEDGSIMAVGELNSDVEYDAILGRPAFEPDILIVRVSADGCIDGYECDEIFYKVPDVTSLTTSTDDETLPTTKKHHINVYPNPSSGFLTLALDDRHRRVMIGIYNMQGQLIEKYYDLSTDKIELNLSHLPSATYVYKIYDGAEVIKAGEWVKM